MAKSPRASRAPKNYDPTYGDKKKKPRRGAGGPGLADGEGRRSRPATGRGSASSRSAVGAQNRAHRDDVAPERERFEDRRRTDKPRASAKRRDADVDGRSDDRARSARRRDDSERSDARRSRPDRGDERGRPARDRDRDNDRVRPPRHRDGDRTRPARGGDRDGERARPARQRDAGRSKPPAKTDRYQAPEDVVLDRLEANLAVPDDLEATSFADLGLGQNICRELADLGAEHPFPIQAATIPIILTGRDVLGRGRTGSGKTIAFGAPLVERLLVANAGKSRRQGRPARALIMAPTRELAMQIDRTVQPIARSVGLFTATVYGGVPQHKQNLALSKGVDILIATPGRLEDMVAQGRIDLGKIDITVLDEADHMCDLGFLEPVQRIMRQTNPEGQRLLFSATLDAGVGEIVTEFLEDPGIYEVPGETQETATIDHRVFVIDPKAKLDVIASLVSQVDRALVFTRTRAFADAVADGLDDRDVMAASLHGDLSQGQRTRALERFSKGRVDVLVATDVAARGIHVDNVDLVVQADPPDDYKTYLHRAGRTGRAGKTGVVVTLIGKTRQRRMSDMLDRAGINAPQITVTPGDASLTHLMG